MHCLPSMPKVMSNKEIWAGGEGVLKYKISHPFSFSKMGVGAVPNCYASPSLSSCKELRSTQCRQETHEIVLSPFSIAAPKADIINQSQSLDISQ